MELLVASSIALVVMGALTSLFALFGRSVSDSQAVVDMNNRMRLAANRLRMDLAGVTAPLQPPLDGESGAGYFEIVEGPQTDISFLAAASPAHLLADTDDRLAFTTRSTTQPFTGKYGDSRLESDVAEISWFCWKSAYQPVQGLELQTLYRRKLLVAGYVGQTPFVDVGQSTNNRLAGASLPAAYNTYDISLRSDPTLSSSLVPNTLSDLMDRRNRFLRGPKIVDPFPFTNVGLYFDTSSGREGEDIVLTNVIGFDVRVLDSQAVAKTDGSSILFPSDQAYGAGSAIGVTGCFIDLGQGATTNGARNSANSPTVLSGSCAPRSGLGGSDGTATYDTWTTHYEYNGFNDDADTDGLIDEGTDGKTNDGDTAVDEADEAETEPPYTLPIKAIEIRIRCYEPSSRQVRQVTIRHAFPE